MEFRELTERYDLEKILRSGKVSTVMRAADRESGQTVAVKMIQAVLLVPPDGFAEAARRFQTHAAALAELHHPCLPTTLDAGVTPDGSAFLVTELLDGRGLDTLAGKVPPDEALDLLGQVLDGLEAMASRGVAHGNLSADNVLVLEGGRVKLLGLASSVFRPSASSARADLHAFATTACQLLGAAIAPGTSPSVQLPFAVALELPDDAALRGILERLLRREPVEPGDVRAAFRKALGKSAAPTAPVPEIHEIQEIHEEAPSPTLLRSAGEEAAAPAPPAPAPVPAPLPAAPPEPEPFPEGSLLPDITDELLDSLAAAPRPAPAAAPVQAPAQTRAAAVTEPPPSRSRQMILLGAAAVLVVAAVLFGFWVLRASSPTASAPAGPAPVAVPPPPPTRAVLAKMEEVRLLLAQGDDEKALEVYRTLTFHDQSSLPPEACAKLADLEGTLSLLAVERLPADLRRALADGDLGLLRSVVATGSGAILPAELQEDFGTARRLVELHRLAEADAAEGRTVAVLERFAEMAALAPDLSDPLQLREKAAAVVEEDAEALAREARYDEAIARLEPLQRTWPRREGLAARAEGYRRYKADEARQAEILAMLPSWERRKRPHEALDLLRGVDPTPHLRPQIEAARTRLEQELAQLDGKAPQVVLRDGYFLEYQRTHTAELSFRVEDDYEVVDVKLMMRPPGGRMREVPMEEVRSRGFWSIEIPLSLHQNGTVEFYVAATDRSGNKGWFGTPDQPKKLTMIGSNRF